jgi:ABC-type amino acid transport substrate-binding protein
MHELSEDLQVRLEFVPHGYSEEELIEQLESGEFDILAGGIMIKPGRLLLAGFTQPYQMATMSIVVPDYRRQEFDTWDDPEMTPGVRLGAIQEDVAATARKKLSDANIVVIDSIHEFFVGKLDVDGLILPAEEGAAWSVLHPEYSVVVPEGVIRRPVGMAVRSSDTEWLSFLNRWLDYKRLEGSLDRLRRYWIEGGGTKKRSKRWCIIRDLLHWVD